MMRSVCATMPIVHSPDRAADRPHRGSAPTPTPHPDRDIVDLHGRVVSGDPAALAEVHQRYAHYLLAVAVRVTGDADAARDVLQEVLVTFWQHPLRFDPNRGELRTWLAVLAHRRAVDWVRRESSRRTTERVARGLVQHVDEAAPGDDLLAREDSDAVRAAVAALPPKQREVVELAYYTELTYRDIATKLAIPEGTAKSRMRAALATLARTLAHQGVAP
ncbi:RNA polymerase, sigma-24 subunit, ECF subfamily [Parafrankia sp. EUN1f]|nr:RNA polymerase, sigma-24 subunit, ECF subfamily [Parafrankia sp. EUN1f]